MSNGPPPGVVTGRDDRSRVADRRLPDAALRPFLAGAFGLAWACWLLAALAARRAGAPSPLTGVLVAVGTAAPSVAAFAVAARYGGRPRVRALAGRLVRARVGARWYAVALLLPPALMGTAVTLHVALGGVRPSFPAPARWPLVVVNFAAVFVFGGPLGEEAGWRGTALPLLARRLGGRGAALALGLVWAAWHLPLAFVPGTPQHDAPYLLLAAQLIAASVLLAWLYGGSGESLLVVMLAHAAVNTWAGPLRVLPAATGSTRPLALATALLGAVALALVARGGAGRSWLALDPATD